jgi:predicted small lipoprotein YifL
MLRGRMRWLAGTLCAVLVCALIAGALVGCGTKKPLPPAEGKETMPGATPPGGSMPAVKGEHMGSKMVKGAGPVGGGTAGTEFGSKGATGGRGAKAGAD